jgi:hypothetical protein
VVRNEIPTPLGRRVLERFARGVAEVCSVINGGDESALLKNAERGFGSNGYRRFAELLEGTAGSGLVIEFSFSSEWKLPSDILKTQTFSIDTRHLELSRRVAKQLQSHYESDLTVSLSESLPSAGDRTTTVVGDVIRLARGDKSGNVADRGSENEIAVQWYHRELGTTRIWIPLGRDDYLQALEAHKQRRSVRVTGTITRNGQFWLLLNPSNFAVI